MNEKQYKGLKIIGILLIIAMISLVLTLVIPVKFKVHCNIDGIELKKLSGNNECYNPFSKDYCPIPKKIDCDISGSFPLIGIVFK